MPHAAGGAAANAADAAACGASSAAAKVRAVMQKARAVFAERHCEKIHANLRDLPGPVADGAADLIEELWREGYDPEAILLCSQQMHAVRHNVNPENLELVYEWLAFQAKHGEKTAFLDAMIYARDAMAGLGNDGVRRLADEGKGERAGGRAGVLH